MIEGFPEELKVIDGRKIKGWPEIQKKLRECGDVLMKRARELHRKKEGGELHDISEMEPFMEYEYREDYASWDEWEADFKWNEKK
jgi:hypothetical protein